MSTASGGRQPNPYEKLDPGPAVATSEGVLVLRDSLRDLFALLGITAAVQLGTVGTRTTIVVSPLALGDARKLVRALDESPHTRVTPR